MTISSCLREINFSAQVYKVCTQQFRSFVQDMSTVLVRVAEPCPVLPPPSRMAAWHTAVRCAGPGLVGKNLLENC